MLFQHGNFTLHSGEVTDWRIDCDAFRDSELYILAKLIAERVLPFHTVVCPSSHHGSAPPKLQFMLDTYYKTSWTTIEKETDGRLHGRILVVDDVLTTGASMENVRKANSNNLAVPVIGAVIFARGQCPDWITPLFRMPA